MDTIIPSPNHWTIFNNAMEWSYAKFKNNQISYQKIASIKIRKSLLKYQGKRREGVKGEKEGREWKRGKFIWKAAINLMHIKH